MEPTPHVLPQPTQQFLIDRSHFQRTATEHSIVMLRRMGLDERFILQSIITFYSHVTNHDQFDLSFDHWSARYGVIMKAQETELKVLHSTAYTSYITRLSWNQFHALCLTTFHLFFLAVYSQLRYLFNGLHDIYGAPLWVTARDVIVLPHSLAFRVEVYLPTQLF